MIQSFTMALRQDIKLLIAVATVLFMYLFFMVGCSSTLPNPDTPIGTAAPSQCERGEQLVIEDGSRRGRRIRFDYCFEQSDQSEDLIYYVHGAFSGHESFWKKNLTNAAFPHYQKVKSLLKDAGKMPKVINISFGNIWTLNDQGLNRSKGNDDYTTLIFVEHIMPYLEKKHKIKDNPKRYLLGISMGGLNGYQLASQYPAKWAKVSLVNPLFPKCLDPWNVMESLVCWSSKDLRIIGSMTMLMGGYDSQAHWDLNNPLGAGAERIKASFPPFQIQWALNDEFHFTKNDKAVCKKLSDKGVQTSCVENLGTHATLNPQEIVYFLFPELRR